MQYMLDATVTMLRAAIEPRQVPTVQAYAGEFNAAEVERLGFTAPALLPTVLGWSPQPRPVRLQGRRVRLVRMALFVVAKHATSRQARMAQAMALADLATHALMAWVPDAAQVVTVSPLLDEPRCENLYGRAIDKQGLALWLLSWDQEARPNVPPAVLYDLTAIEILDTTQQGVAPAPATVPGPDLVVTEDVAFAPLPFAV